MKHTARDEIRSRIAENMRGFQRLESSSPRTPAAVAIVLLESEPSLTIPIFQRPSSMSRHASQMALPGGKLHDGELAVGAAIREAHEELGLELDGDAVLGRLDDFDTMSGFTITPVVLSSPVTVKELRPSSAEVGRLFTFTVDQLHEAAASAGAGTSFSLRLPGVEVFAPTAAILYQFSETALDGRHTRVAHFHQPPFTHR